ncbi:putative defense protein 3 [Acanthaster planci]|uniref:Defense protein 3 n=1 Tax=Acanthaster planci TaxID=133434 RepID=A0A8B7YWY3_ACAPL|nr:putative defense protein 3 [Acanthaster planci]
MYRTVWLLLAILPAALARGSGPPTSEYPTICITMEPGHGSSPASGKAPYAISLDSDTYTKGNSIEVSIYATEPDNYFRGFFIQARRVGLPSLDAVGSFISEPTEESQFIKCGTQNSAWGHANRNKKTKVTARWIGPSTSFGPLVFNATIVGLKKEDYWTGVMSSEILYGNANGVKGQGLLLSTMVLLAYVLHK